MKRILVTVCVLLSVIASTYAGVYKFPLMFNDGEWTNAIAESTECTTQVFIMYPGRAFSVSWRQYINVGAADSVITKLYYRITLDSSDAFSYWSQWDTLPTQTGYVGQSVANPGDTIGGADLQEGPFSFYPPVSYWGQFRVVGQVGSSDSGNVGYFYLMMDDLR